MSICEMNAVGHATPYDCAVTPTRIQFNTCAAGADAGFACDVDGDCAASTCSSVTNNAKFKDGGDEYSAEVTFTITTGKRYGLQIWMNGQREFFKTKRCTTSACTAFVLDPRYYSSSDEDVTTTSGPNGVADGMWAVAQIDVRPDEIAGCSTNADCTDSEGCTDDLCTDGDCSYTNNTDACDDGVYCNGTDTCSGGTCSVNSGDPCDSMVGDLDSDCSETCDEALDTCTATDPDYSLCDDGVYCDGVDECISGTCTSNGTDPCLPLDVTDIYCNTSCDETTDTCTANDPDATVCDDGIYCNGADTCTSGICSTNAGDPCSGGSECQDVCTEEADTCLSALGTACSTDGEICTDDVCNGLGFCVHIPDATNDSSCTVRGMRFR